MDWKDGYPMGPYSGRGTCYNSALPLAVQMCSVYALRPCFRIMLFLPPGSRGQIQWGLGSGRQAVRLIQVFSLSSYPGRSG